MVSEISRRAVLGGTIAGAAALAGMGALGGVAIAQDQSQVLAANLAADEELFVGFARATIPFFDPEPISWRWVVSDDGAERLGIAYNPESGERPLKSGTRVWAARQRRGSDERLDRQVRVLRVAPASSLEASAAHHEAERNASANGQWVKARVFLPVWQGRTEPHVLCELPGGKEGGPFMRVRPVGALRTAQRHDPLLLKVGRTYEGWQVFEARTVRQAMSYDI